MPLLGLAHKNFLRDPLCSFLPCLPAGCQHAGRNRGNHSLKIPGPPSVVKQGHPTMTGLTRDKYRTFHCVQPLRLKKKGRKKRWNEQGSSRRQEDKNSGKRMRRKMPSHSCHSLQTNQKYPYKDTYEDVPK